MGNPFRQFLDQSAHDHARMVRSQAKVRAESEGDMGIRLAVELDFVRLSEDLGIAVGGLPAKRDAAFRLYLESKHVCPHRTDPSNMRERDEDPEKLLGCEGDPIGIFADPQ